MTINNVNIGDKFISSNDTRSKRISTVVDFYKTVSMTTGKDTGTILCIAEKEFLGEIIRFETPFATVVRNKITPKN